jgi:ATP-binding cassette, subfamily C, bacterial
MESLRAFLRLLGQAPRAQIVGLVVLMFLSSATDGVGFVLLVPLLQMIGGTAATSAGSGTLGQAMNWLSQSVSTGGLLLGFVLLIGLRNVIQYARETLSQRIQFNLVDQMRLQTFSALLAVEWRWLNGQRQSDHASLLLTNISGVGTGLNYGLGLFANIAAILVYLTVAFMLSPEMTVLVAATGGLVFRLLMGHQREAFRLGTEGVQASRALHRNVQESLAGIKLSKILGSEDRHVSQLTETMRSVRENRLKFASNTGISRGIFQFGGAVLLASYIYFGLYAFKVPVPELLTLVLIFSRMVPMFMSMQNQFHHWMHALPALLETETLLAECRAAKEPLSQSQVEPWAIMDAVSLQNVSLTYTGRQRPALSEVMLRLPVRTTTAIMGPSGSGKSTLADIIMGLLAPDAGQLLVDAVPVTGDARIRWRRSVAYVPQDNFLFNDSIRTNLLWSKPDASEDELNHALRQASADFVFDLPEGLETQVGDSGVRLSGGERQRLALARALLQRPSLLILDEATSALDVANEARIRDAIERLHGDLTVLIIGHRLPTLEHADQVVLLEAGEVVASGTWAEVGNRSSQQL